MRSSATRLQFDRRRRLAGCISPGVVERERVPGRSLFRVRRCRGRAGGRRLDGARHQLTARSALPFSISSAKQKPPFSPERVVAGFSRILRSFGLRSVQADRHGRGPFAEVVPAPRHLLRRFGPEQGKPLCRSHRQHFIELDRVFSIYRVCASRSWGWNCRPRRAASEIAMPRARDGKALHDDVVNCRGGRWLRAGARRRMTVLEGLAVEERGHLSGAARA